MLEVRNKLKDLLSRTESNDRLEDLLAAIVNDDAARQKLVDTMGVGAGGGGGEEAAPEAGDGGEEAAPQEEA